MKLTSTRPPASRCATSKAKPVHHMPLETNSSSVPSRPSISAAPRKSGTRNTRILAIDVSNTPSSTPADRQLGQITATSADRAAAGRRPCPNGHEDAGDQRDVEQQLQRRGELDQRQMPAGIFQHHRLVHHGELEVRRRVVDRDARVLGERHDDQRDQRRAPATRAGRRSETP